MAIKKTSPFIGGKDDPKRTSSTPSLPNDDETLRLRKEKRLHIDFDAVSLELCYDTNNELKPVYRRDLTGYVKRFPHHEELTRQLICGVTLSGIGVRKASHQTYQNSALAIESFIECLNSDEPLLNNVYCVAEINFSTAKMFHSWLLRTAPGRTTNRKLYASIRSSVLALQKKHSHLPRVGKSFHWPAGPQQNENVTESYPAEIFNMLVDSCLSDINQIIPLMSEFRSWLKLTPSFTDGDNIRPRWRGKHGEKQKCELTINQSERMAYATAHRLYPNWPLGMELDDATATFCFEKARSNSDLTLAEERARRVIQSSRLGSDSAPIVSGQLAYFSHFAFSSNTLYPFFLFVQLNTGWNQESILALTDCLDDHIEQDLVDEHYCIIYSTKQRTQKTVSHRSNTKSPLSVYRVLRFVESQVKSHRSSQHYIPGTLWQFIPSKNLWPRHQRILAALDAQNISGATRSFLKRHNIDLPGSSKCPGIESRKIRTTYQTRRREQGLSTDTIADLMGHADIDTTAQHYDSDSGSNELKNRQIRHLQNNHLDDLRNYHARLAQSSTLQDLRDAIARSPTPKSYERASNKLGNVTVGEIIHLLSPEGQTYIAACTNPKIPRWQDADRFLSPGDKCNYFNRCCMCNNAVIFRESLPWVIRRISDLEALRTRIATPEWALNYAEELSGWEWVISKWNNLDDVTEARKLATSDDYALPLTMIGG